MLLDLCRKSVEEAISMTLLSGGRYLPEILKDGEVVYGLAICRFDFVQKGTF